MTRGLLTWTKEYDDQGDADYVAGPFRIKWHYGHNCYSGKKWWSLYHADGREWKTYSTLADAKNAAERIVTPTRPRPGR